MAAMNVWQKRLWIATLLLLLLPVTTHSASIADDLQQIGTGQAYYLKFIKVYDATFYGEQTAVSTDGILSDAVSKCLHLVYAVTIRQEELVEAAGTVLKRQFPAKILTRFKDELDTLHGGYQDVRKGDTYTLCYDSSTFETSLDRNGTEVVKIHAPDFAGVYFSIWLGADQPLDKKLRDDLLAEL